MPSCEAAAGDLVDDRDLLGHQRRRPQRGQQHGGADGDRAGAGGDRGEERERLRQVAVGEEVVLGEPHRAEATLLGPLDQLEVAGEHVGPRPGPRLGVAEVEEQPDLHRLLTLSRRRCSPDDLPDAARPATVVADGGS